MQVRLISHDKLDSLQVPWKISRPGQSDQQTEDIMFDAQLLEFCHATFEMNVPIIIRDVVCGYCDHVVWAQTSRVNDPANGFSCWGYTPPEENARLIEEMQQRKKHGTPQDEYRYLLPVDAYTTFACKLSARRVAKMYKFCRDSGNVMLVDFAVALRVAIGHYWGLDLLANKVKYEDPWPMIDEHEHYDVPPVQIRYALFAQLIRHRNLEVHSNLFEHVSDMGHGEEALRLGDYIEVAIRGSRHFLADVAAKRNCWIAQGDLWGPLINEINAQVGFQLPCDTTSCPFSADNISRCRKEDPNPPCPIFLKQDPTPLGDTLRKDLSDYNHQRGEAVDFWDGFIRSMP